MTDSQDISNDLSAWIDGELSDARSEQVAKAVQSDPALAAEADELRQVASLLSQFAPPALPDDFAQRIAAQAIPPKPSHFPRWASLCVAASVLVATGTALLLFQNDDIQQPSLAYNDESKENRIAATESITDDSVELKTEAEAIHRRMKDLDEKLYTEKKDHRDLEVPKVAEELADTRSIRPAKPVARFPVASKRASKTASKTAGKKAGKYKGSIAKDATPGQVLSPVASNPQPTRQIGKKADNGIATGDGPVNQTMGRAGPGRYDAALNMDQARTEAQATVTMMQNSLPVAQTVPGGPPGQKPIQFQAFRTNQHRQAKNGEQSETVYAKSLKAGQQRIEGLLYRNGIELVKQNQPLLNNRQAVLVGGWSKMVARAQVVQAKATADTSDDSQTDAPVTGQLKYMVFGGQSQIKELRSQVQVLNAANKTAKAEEVAADQVDSLAKEETIPAPILEGDVKPTAISSDIDPPDTETRQRTAKSKSHPAKRKQQRSSLSPPPVDVLIITVEERK